MKKQIVALSPILVSAMLSATGATVPIDCYLEYLGSAEAQIVNTGYVFTKKPRVEAWAKVTSDSDRYIFGTSDKEASNLFSAKYWGKNKYLTYYRYGSTSPVMNRATIDDFYNKWIDFVWSDVVTHDGVVQGVPAPAADFSGNTAPFWLFGCGAGKGHINFQYVKMYDGGLLVRDLCPVKSNGVAGMYDLLNDVFYPNVGTGTFKTGAVVPAVGTRGSCGSFGTPTPAYGVVPNSDSTIAFSLEGARTFADGVTAYPSDDGLERAQFQGLSVSCDGGEPIVTSGTTYTFDVPDGTQAVSAEWAFTDRQVCLSLAQAGGGSAELYVDDEKVDPGDYWMEDGKTVTIRIVPTEGGRYLGCKGSDWRAKSQAQEFSVSLAGQGLAVTARVESASYVGPVRTWVGGTMVGDSYRASVAANWADGLLPESGDTIVFDATSTSDCRWDLDIKPGSWTQTVDFVSTVTFAMTYDGDFPFLEVTGDVDLQGGKWTHPANGATVRAYRLYVKIGGAMTIGPRAQVSAYGCGYSKQYSPVTGAFVDLPSKNYAAHGGYGYAAYTDVPAPAGVYPYGKVRAPEEPGSGSSGNGGGAIRLDVIGALTLDGSIDANAVSNVNYGGAGGSVYLRAGTISGAGEVTANATCKGNDCGYGSGGRVAIVLTDEGATFDEFDPSAKCSAFSSTAGSNTCFGQPGTIYAETPQDAESGGWLIIKGPPTNPGNAYCRMTPIAGYGEETVKFGQITLINGGAAIWVPEYASLDMSEMTAGNFAGPIILSGGAWAPPSEGVVDYALTSYGGLGAVNSTSLTIVSGGSLKLCHTVEPAFKGDLTVAEGVTVTAEGPLSVTGDLTVDGTITRTTTLKPVEVNVGGDLTIGASGQISALKLGYANNTCPPDQVYGGKSGSHGAWGWAANKVGSANSSCYPYGSVREPQTYGSGGVSQIGGGVIKIVVEGKLTNSGTITASAPEGGYYTAAGGSVNIRTGELAGEGIITASGAFQSFSASKGYALSAGGRLAIRLTKAGADFSSYTGPITADGVHQKDPPENKEYTGGAGTKWFKTATEGEDEGTLVIDNSVRGLTSYTATLLGGDFMAEDELAYKNVIVQRSAKLQLWDGKTLVVSGVFSNGCEFAAGTGTTVLFSGSTPSAIYGDTTFTGLSCQTPGKEIRIGAGSTVTVAEAASFTGTAENPIVLTSTVDGEQWNLVGAAVTMDGVALKDCNAASAITVLNGTDLGGNSANITFKKVVIGELLTWTGGADGAWANAANWDKDRAPVSTDKVLVPSGTANAPTLGTDVGVAELTVEEGASLALGGKTLVVNGPASIAGSLLAGGAATLEVKGNLSLLGSFTPETSTVRLGGAQEKTLTVADGVAFNALDLGIGTVSVAGDVKADALSVGDGAADFAITFGDGAKVEVNTFTARGDAAKTNGVLTVADGGVWKLVANVPSVSGVAVTGSDASEGVTIVPTDCADGGRNVNWLFVDTRTHWDGASWSDGEPTAEKDAVVDAGATLVVDADLAVRNLTVSPTATVKVNASLVAAGSVVVEPNGSLEWNRPGTVGGNLTILSGATLSHAANTTTEANKIDLTVAGSGYVAAGAAVNVKGRGYSSTSAGPSPLPSGTGAAHGGNGYVASTGAEPYGSILCPTNLGSCGNFNGSNYPGGGAVRLAFGGALKLDGEINADATGGAHYTGSGGSIWLSVSELNGSGSVHAEGPDCNGYGIGAGGRVAVYLTAATSLDSFGGEVQAYGGGNKATLTTTSNPGTVYVQTAADAPGAGVLTIANRTGHGSTPATNDTSRATDLQAKKCCVPGEARRMSVVVKDYGVLSLNDDAEVRSLSLADATSLIKLNGHKLRVHSVKPKGWLDARVVTGDGGTIDWNQKGLMLIVK